MRKKIEQKYRMETGKFLLFMITFFTIFLVILILSKEKDDFKPLNLNSEQINYSDKQ